MAKMLKIALLFAATLTVAACDSGTSTAKPGETAGKAGATAARDWTTTVVQTPEGGFRMGNPDAKVKLVEFASFTCSHCRDFHNAGSEPLKTGFVKTGQVSYEYRPFMLNVYDFTAATLAMCEGPDRFFFWANQLYTAHEAWIEPFTKLTDADIEPLKALAPNQQVKGLATAGKLDQFAKTRGLPGAKFDACFGDQKTFEALQARQNAAVSQFNIQGTPTFVLNGAKLDGVTTWEQLEPKIKAAL